MRACRSMGDLVSVHHQGVVAAAARSRRRIHKPSMGSRAATSATWLPQQIGVGGLDFDGGPLYLKREPRLLRVQGRGQARRVSASHTATNPDSTLPTPYQRLLIRGQLLSSLGGRQQNQYQRNQRDENKFPQQADTLLIRCAPCLGA
jgi:hypothetical protein